MNGVIPPLQTDGEDHEHSYLLNRLLDYLRPDSDRIRLDIS